MKWLNVCSVSDLQNDSGICALVNGEQIALFYVENTVYAVSNFDPFGNANVLSRGVIGDLKGQIVVASPLYKQHFNLETGVCLEDESVILPVYASRIENDTVQIGVTS
ncbi:MAG: nitrite reductase small subunit NirD [Methylococcaceae bacterium]|nr:nitrite reductase small subunit NirD [Methylococcaceae bacterium]